MALSRITEAVASFTDLTIGDDLTLTDDLLLASDANIIKFGADAEVTLTHVHNTGLLLNSTSVIQFNDASQNIGAPSATVLDINATDEIELNATLVDVNANLDVSGTIVSGGTLTATTSIGIGSAVLTEAELELLDGITAGTAAASKVLVLDSDKDIGTIRNLTIDGVFTDGNYTFDTSGNVSGLGTVGSGAITSSGTVQGTDLIATNSVIPNGANGASLGSASAEFSDLFLHDGAVINLGADQDVTLTHVADTGVLVNSASVIQFRDSAINIGSPADGDLDINADAEIELNSTLVDVNANLDVSGTALVTGVLTTTAATVFNGGFASNADSTMGTDKKIIFRDAAIHISSTADGDLSIAADDEIDLTSTLIDINGNATVSGTLGVTGIATFTDDIIIGDGKTIGSASDPDAITIASNGQLTLTQTLIGTALDISGDIDIDGTTNLDIVDIDGAVNVAADVTIASTNKIIFNDASQFIQGASGTVLDIAATDEIELTATLIEVVGNATVSGTLGVTGIATFTDDIIIGDGKTIGSASDVDAITIASTGVTTFSKAVVGATSTDTSNTGNVTLDFASFTNFVLTFTGNVTLDNPTTEVVGQSGFIVCIQDGTGSRTLSLGTDYETAGSGGITLSTAANARDIIPYAVSAAGSVILGAVQKAFG
jgi:hypothetical protein